MKKRNYINIIQIAGKRWGKTYKQGQIVKSYRDLNPKHTIIYVCPNSQPIDWLIKKKDLRPNYHDPDFEETLCSILDTEFPHPTLLILDDCIELIDRIPIRKRITALASYSRHRNVEMILAIQSIDLLRSRTDLLTGNLFTEIHIGGNQMLTYKGVKEVAECIVGFDEDFWNASQGITPIDDEGNMIQRGEFLILGIKTDE